MTSGQHPHDAMVQADGDRPSSCPPPPQEWSLPWCGSDAASMHPVRCCSCMGTRTHEATYIIIPFSATRGPVIRLSSARVGKEFWEVASRSPPHATPRVARRSECKVPAMVLPTRHVHARLFTRLPSHSVPSVAGGLRPSLV